MVYSKLIEGFILVLIVASILNPASSLVVGEQGYKNILVFFIPSGDPYILLNTTNTSAQLKTLLVRLENDQHAPLDYYISWILTGVKPESTSIDITKELLNQSRIVTLWSNATFVNVPPVDPANHSSTINPLVNFDENHLPPGILEIPINKTIHWDTLNTDLTAKLEGESIQLTLLNYNLTTSTPNYTSNRALGPLEVRVQRDNNTVSYHLLFYTLEVSNNTIKLLFPGAMRTTGYASTGFTPFNDVFIHWYTLVKYRDLISKLDEDSVNWWIAQVYGSSMRFLRKALSESNNSLIYAYLPELDIVGKYVGVNWYNKSISEFYKLLVNELTIYASSFKPDYLAVFILCHNSEYYAVFASRLLPTTGELEEKWTMSQLSAILLSYSSTNPFNHIQNLVVNKEASNLNKQLDELKQNITQLNQTLVDTSSQLRSCEADRELYRSKVIEQDKVLAQVEDLKKTSLLYLTSGLALVLGVTIILGFMALRVASRKRSS
jgi:hypothetical protein